MGRKKIGGVWLTGPVLSDNIIDCLLKKFMSERRAIYNYVRIMSKNETILANLGISLGNKI